MKTIVFNSQKGGSGKTMLVKHLSVQAEKSGDGPVYIIDNDEQATFTRWHQKREAETPTRVDLPFEEISKGLAHLRAQGASYCFVDTASGRLEIASHLFALADLVVFPVQPSEDDLSAAPVTVRNLKATNVKFVFVLTRAKANTLITAQAAAILSQHGRVAQTFVGDRVGYKSPYPHGQTVIEARPKSDEAREISALWQNIKSCISENNNS